jgi:hypothetical protein
VHQDAWARCFDGSSDGSNGLNGANLQAGDEASKGSALMIHGALGFSDVQDACSQTVLGW